MANQPHPLTPDQATLLAAALAALAAAPQVNPQTRAALIALANALPPGIYQDGIHRIERGQRVDGGWDCDGYQGITIYANNPFSGRHQQHLVAAFWNTDQWRADTQNTIQATRR